MTRVLGIVGSMLLAFLILVPAVAAADPWPAWPDWSNYENARTLVSIGGDVTLPDGDDAENLVIIAGTATIYGDVKSLVVINGTANLIGSTANDVFAAGSALTMDGSSVVTGDVRSVESTIAQAPGALVVGEVHHGFDFARGALWIAPLLALLYAGFVVAALAAALFLAAFASRQVRATQDLISREPAGSFFAGILGVLSIAVAGTLAIVTIIGIPLGLGIVLGVIPVLAVSGYAIAAIWIGDWFIRQRTPTTGTERTRPFPAAIVGTLVLGVVGLVPGVGGFASLFGIGAIVLHIWRGARRDATTNAAPQPATVPANG